MKIPIIKISQNGNTFYVGKILAADLLKVATSKIRRNYSTQESQGYLNEIDKKVRSEIEKGSIWYLKDVLVDPNVQRRQSEKRLKEIGEYLSSSDAIYPNSIIINLASRDDNKKAEELVKISDNEISYDDKEIVVTVIDGQHRLGGFRYCELANLPDNFELLVTIMIGLEISQQAELFGVINGRQVPVSKSILYDLSELSEQDYTEVVTAHLISKWFNINKQSPLFGKIKMLGYGEGTISQAAFIDALLPLIAKPQRLVSDNILIPVLRETYLKKDDKDIIKKLYDYFKAFKEIFFIEWNYETHLTDKIKYILTKSTGISGLFFAYPTFYCYLHAKQDFQFSTIYSLIEKLKAKNFDFSSKKYGGGGVQVQRQLCNDMLAIIFEGQNIASMRREYIEYFNKHVK